jgi:hypothetical protein
MQQKFEAKRHLCSIIIVSVIFTTFIYAFFGSNVSKDTTVDQTRLIFDDTVNGRPRLISTDKLRACLHILSLQGRMTGYEPLVELLEDSLAICNVYLRYKNKHKRIAIATLNAPQRHKITGSERTPHFQWNMYISFVKYTYSNIAAYGQYNGYSYFFMNTFLTRMGGRSVKWSKIDVTKHYIKTKRYNWVLWMVCNQFGINGRMWIFCSWTLEDDWKMPLRQLARNIM